MDCARSHGANTPFVTEDSVAAAISSACLSARTSLKAMASAAEPISRDSVYQTRQQQPPDTGRPVDPPHVGQTPPCGPMPAITPERGLTPAMTPGCGLIP